MTTIPDRFPTQVLDRVAAAARAAGTWSVSVQLAFDGPLDVDRLRRASELLVEAEPWLGCRFVHTGRQPHWERFPEAAEQVFVSVKDAETYARLQRAPVDLETGPLVRVVHVPADVEPKGSDQAAIRWGGSGDRLMLSATHAMADGGGMLHAVMRLAELYRTLADDPNHRPAPDLAASRSLWQLWWTLPWGSSLQILSNAGQRIRQQRTAFPCHQLLIPEDDPDEAETETNFLRRSIPSEPLKAYARERGARVNDMLQAAFLRALVRVQPWDGTTSLSVNSTVDLRRYLPTGRARAICNLSSGQMLSLGNELGDTFDDTLSRVSAITTARKRRLIGLSVEVIALNLVNLIPYAMLLRNVNKMIARPRKGGQPADTVTNIGIMRPEWLVFDTAPVDLYMMPQFLEVPRYQVVAYGFRDHLTLVGTVGPSAVRERTVSTLLDTMVEEITPP